MTKWRRLPLSDLFALTTNTVLSARNRMDFPFLLTHRCLCKELVNRLDYNSLSVISNILFIRREFPSFIGPRQLTIAVVMFCISTTILLLFFWLRVLCCIEIVFVRRNKDINIFIFILFRCYQFDKFPWLFYQHNGW